MKAAASLIMLTICMWAIITIIISNLIKRK